MTPIIAEYPKIDTLFDRNKDTFKIDPSLVRRPEFDLIDTWVVTEKIDGTNVRVALMPDGTVVYTGRTADAQMHPQLLAYLRATFPGDAMRTVLWPDATPNPLPVVLYGEGYGPKIQGGGKYRADVAFRLFDVLSGVWWLKDEDVSHVATALGVRTVPVLGVMNRNSAIGLVCSLKSRVAQEEGGVVCAAEGVVARSPVQLFNRMGERLMWKLKAKDL